MNKTYQTKLHRIFLISELPEPLKRSSSHLQISDNYIVNTRLRIRSMRSPETNKRTFFLQQRFPVGEDYSHWKISEIYLNEVEHALFERFEGRELRRNRYYFDLDGRQIEIDVFLGELWGLIIAKACFETEKDFEDFEIPPFAIAEITHNPFFFGENFIGKHYQEIQAEFMRMNETNQIILNENDE